MAEVELEALRDLCRATQLACQRAVPVASLDAPLSELSSHLPERVRQLKLLVTANQVVRHRVEDSLRLMLRRLGYPEIYGWEPRRPEQ